MTQSTNIKVGDNKIKNIGRKEIQNEWNDEFEVVDRKDVKKSNKP